MAAEKLTYTAFKDEVAIRLHNAGQSVTKETIDKVLDAFKEEVVDCLVNGYAIVIPGFIRFEPKLTPALAKGDLVFNPTTLTKEPRKEARPAGFKAKAYMSSTVSKAFPSTTTAAGKNLQVSLS